ncbi:MAG TPA: ATP-binding cassette domain-containing protein [Rubrivivax sp.]|nr:ATP-binding cassette domain-containing protein [Burkholderiales bacterium]HNT40092.1 ATP-binding cassette domain-containing protein [Rubrivivax sp.]
MLEIRGLHHAWGVTEVLRDVSLHLHAGELLALVGPSGCGKTTLLHLAAGLLPLQTGSIRRAVARPAMLFQQPRLLPWQRTIDNIGIGLRAQGVPRASARERARALGHELGLDDRALHAYPHELSGGMQSRAALARALLLEPALLLLDEPFSALDVGLRAQLHTLLLDHVQRRRTAVLLITHDLMEAVRLADSVLVMAPTPGRLVYRQPVAGPALARDDVAVHRLAAELLAVPVLRQAFDLPPLEPACLPA